MARIARRRNVQRHASALVVALLVLASGGTCTAGTAGAATAGAALRGSTATSSSDATAFGPGMPSCGTSHTIPPLDAVSAARDPSLVQVQVFIRHGDRTPTSAGTCWSGQDDDPVWTCPLTQLQRNSVAPRNSSTSDVGRMYDLAWDPRREALRGNCGLAQLTSIGVAQQHGNGQGLAAAYVSSGVLPSSYFGNEDAFFLRSDDTDRTIQSGQALFTGMYPPASSGDTEVVGWNTMDRTYDPIGFNPVLCPALTTELAAAGNSPASKNFTASVLPFAEALSREIGAPLSSDFFGAMQDCGVTHGCHGHPVPAALSGNFSEVLHAAYTQFSLLFAYGNVTRFAIGPLVNKTWTNMQAVMRGDAGAKRFRLVSGHDLAPIMPLLFAFGVEDGTWPYYASLISLELYKVEASWAVRMVYNDRAVKVRGCDALLCDIDQFAATVEALIPTAAECAAPTAASTRAAHSRADAATRLVHPLGRR